MKRSEKQRKAGQRQKGSAKAWQGQHRTQASTMASRGTTTGTQVQLRDMQTERSTFSLTAWDPFGPEGAAARATDQHLVDLRDEAGAAESAGHMSAAGARPCWCLRPTLHLLLAHGTQAGSL
jgi:hypothetical protein